MIQTISISDKCCSSELFIHQRILEKKSTQLFSTLFIYLFIIIFFIIFFYFIYFFEAANHHIRMISKGSCDWSNDAKNSALITAINYILKLSHPCCCFLPPCALCDLVFRLCLIIVIWFRCVLLIIFSCLCI